MAPIFTAFDKKVSNNPHIRISFLTAGRFRRPLKVISRSVSITSRTQKQSHLLLMVTMQLLLRSSLFIGILLLAKATAMPVSSGPSQNNSGNAGASPSGRPDCSTSSSTEMRLPFPVARTSSDERIECHLVHYAAGANGPSLPAALPDLKRVAHALSTVWSPAFWSQPQAISKPLSPVHVIGTQLADPVFETQFKQGRLIAIMAKADTTFHIVILDDSLNTGSVWIEYGKPFFKFSKGEYWVCFCSSIAVTCGWFEETVS
ncbi:hypothetical protein FB446DRAFT_274493 [Lentinula raphanica]|nr:hypothetical protein FB446DRAFT_274493 [Lentinula raphanica]